MYFLKKICGELSQSEKVFMESVPKKFDEADCLSFFFIIDEKYCGLVSINSDNRIEFFLDESYKTVQNETNLVRLCVNKIKKLNSSNVVYLSVDESDVDFIQLMQNFGFEFYKKSEKTVVLALKTFSVSNEFAMQVALDEAYDGIGNGDGGPFGSVITKNGVIVGRGHNCVLKKHDPTCHGEMEAIRDACKNLKTHDLDGCVLFTTAEPCPMCLGGILWANIKKVYFGCTVQDTASIGFRDGAFYDCLKGNNDVLSTENLNRNECIELFDAYKNDIGRQNY